MKGIAAEVTDVTRRLRAARERGGLGLSMCVMLRQAEQMIIDLFQIHQEDRAEITRLRRMIEAKEGET